jgi:hypothetical protein
MFNWRTALAVLVAVSMGLAAQTEEKFKTRLAPVAMDIAMRANIAGTGSAAATLNGNKVTVTGSFDGLLSNATNAHLHQGLAPGVRGPLVFNLTVTTTKTGTISGNFDLTADQTEAFRKGKFYVVINSEKAPDGNLWGWLMPSK